MVGVWKIDSGGHTSGRKGLSACSGHWMIISTGSHKSFVYDAMIGGHGFEIIDNAGPQSVWEHHLIQGLIMNYPNPKPNTSPR
jgi:hypothetical protein